EARATIVIAADCALGEHKLRLVTATGISPLQTFWVSQFPNATEKEPNNGFAAPQAVPLNTTVEGTVQNEDVDYYRVTAKKGQVLSAEIEAIRLSNTLFDPYIAILDAKRFELDAADDTPLLLQDCFASIVAQADGDYWIEVRDSSYGGGGNSRYRLHIGQFPRPRAIFPAGGQAGTDTEVRFIGAKGELPVQAVSAPAKSDTNFGVLAKADGFSAPSSNPFRVSPFPNVLEKEPNENRNNVPFPEASLPLAFNGIIDKDGDIDWFAFNGKKGQRIHVRVHARSIRSPLDSVLNVYGPDGKNIQGNDDSSGSADSRVTVALPADGKHFIRVTDHLRKGGEDYVYRVEAKPVAPELATFIPRFRAQDTQSRQMMPIPRGNRIATVLQVTRGNFGGPLKFAADKLPDGITMHAAEMPPNIDRFPVVFEAKPEAELASALVDVNVAHSDAKKSIRGQFGHTVEMVRGPGNRIFYRTEVDRLAVAVTAPVPFRIEIDTPPTAILQRGSLNLKVRAIRDEGFDNAITLRLPWKPPGVSSAGTISLPKGKSEIDYPLTANGSAAVGTWHLAVLGEANTKTGPTIVSSALTELRVEQPYVNIKIEMAAIERGQSGDLLCTVEQLRPFDGEAEILLSGLPANTSTEPRKITKETKELIFPIASTKDARARTSKTLFTAISIPWNGHLLRQSAGSGGQLRIDNPPKPRKNAPPKPKPVAAKKEAPKPKPEKPLSRLEKLRLIAKERAAERAAQETP
ncbi:MAG: PPC domain-containing protein, partial [Verrucomicrobiota bacterium]|nr:PPC domain-containing protein [Verrucomicrobiota bacterium]